MRILHIDTERGWRGGERQALWLAVELAQRGHASIIAARPDEPLVRRATEAGIDVLPCTPTFEADPLAVVQLRRVLRRNDIDLVHAHTAHALTLGALATLGTRIPLVAARRVDFPLRRNVGTRWKYGRAAAIVAVSRAVARVVTAGGIDAARVVIIPDGTDVHRTIGTASAATLLSLGIEPGRPLAVQVAQLVSHKDPLNFVRAIADARERVPELQAVLVGDGPLRSEVESAVTSLGLDHSLRVAGYRMDADALLAAADVAVLSSREEGMGSVLLDALLLGKPIAATTAGGIPEVVIDGVNGLLAPVGDSHALGANIARLVSDRTLALQFGAAAREHVREFSVERMTERTLEVYQRVIARHSPEGRDDTTRRTAAATRASSDSSIRAS
jgi:glycosyltransferase involved in cell wall biosynthesis